MITQVIESLLVVEACLRRYPRGEDVETGNAIHYLYTYLSRSLHPPSLILPQPEYSDTPPPTNDEYQKYFSIFKTSSFLALQCLATLMEHHPSFADLSFDITGPLALSLSIFTNLEDPWTTPPAHRIATDLLTRLMARAGSSSSILGKHILQDTIRPLFLSSAQSNPSVTPMGRATLSANVQRSTHTTLTDELARGEPLWATEKFYLLTSYSWVLTQLDVPHLHPPISSPSLIAF